MRKLKRGDVLTQNNLKTGVLMEKNYQVNMEGKQPSYILNIKGNRYLVRRTGECKPKECASACCKIISYNISGKYSDGEPVNRYFKGFADKIIGGHAIMEKKCVSLCKSGLCSVWKKKNQFPGPCKEFPHPIDGVYVAVEPVCSFKFIIDEVLAPKGNEKIDDGV